MSILRNISIHKTNAIKEGIKIVRKVLATHDSLSGFTTAELYQLALRQPSPPGYQGDPRLSSDVYRGSPQSPPPHNEHPVRSKSFLKRSILPALEENKEVVKVVEHREVTSPVPVIARGKKKVPARNTKETADGSPANPVIVKTWVWKVQSPNTARWQVGKFSQLVGAAVGVGQDWSHLNKRRQRTRQGKVQRDLATMKEILAQEKGVAQAS